MRRNRPRRSKSWIWVTLIVVAVAIAAGVVWIKRKSPRPDAIFLIVVDTLRPDRLSCYGYREHNTPHIDRLAKAGVRFQRAQSVASWTIPSMGSIMTSLYPTQLGLVELKAPPGKRFEWQERREQNAHSIPLRELTLAEILRSEGFRTAGFVNQPGLIVGDGFVQGFEDWYYPDTPDTIRRRIPGERVKYKRWAPFLQKAAIIDIGLLRQFDTWLVRHANEKMFVWLHFLTPHRPYNPPTSYSPPPRYRTDLSKNYDGEVRFIDALIGEVLHSIETRVGWARSFIIFTSDHGEAFGEHKMFEHGHTLHREVIHVPLILTAEMLPAGHIVGSYVRTIDILPTILDFLGVRSAAPEDIEGSSLLPLLSRKTADRPVYSEAMLYGSTERSLIINGHKLMYDEQDEQYALFDTRTDRYEERSVLNLQTRLAMNMRTALSDLYKDLLFDYRLRWDEAPEDSTITREEARRLLDALRSLGYVNE